MKNASEESQQVGGAGVEDGSGTGSAPGAAGASAAGGAAGGNTAEDDVAEGETVEETAEEPTSRKKLNSIDLDAPTPAANTDGADGGTRPKLGSIDLE